MLTNGDDDRIYNAFAKAEAERKLFRAIRLSDRPSRPLVLDTLLLLYSEILVEKRIDQLWKVEYIDRLVRERALALFAEPSGALVRLIARQADDLKPGEVRDSLRRAEFEIKFPAGLEPPAETKDADDEDDDEGRSGTGDRAPLADLIRAGIVAPGTQIEVTYKGQSFTAVIDDAGSIVFDGRSFSSPSAAGGDVITKVKGEPPPGKPTWPTSGWTFWKYRDASGDLHPIADWSDAYRARKSKAES